MPAYTSRRSNAGSIRSHVLAVALGLCAALPVTADAVIIPRTITLDGDMSDWGPVDLNNDGDTLDPGEGRIVGDSVVPGNPGQFSEDAEGKSASCSNPVQPDEDQDCTVQGTGRDLEYFAFTFDDDNLYMFVRRYASLKNITNWWFYLDLDADGLLQDGEKVLRVAWQGNTGNTVRTLYDYTAAAQGGDPLTIGGSADGYTMPGTIPSQGTSLLPDYNAGATTIPQDGLEMETVVRWDELDPSATGPFSVGFHISASNTQNIPGGIDDNMNGPAGGGGGGLFQFSNPGLTKTGDLTGVGGQPIEYVVTITNAGPDAATGIEVTDACEDLEIVSRDPPFGPSLLTGETLLYAGHTASNDIMGQPTQYDLVTGIWTIATLATNASETLTLRCRANVDEPIRVRNNAEITELATIDTDLSDNTAASDTTVVEPAPDLMIVKSSNAQHDPVNEGDNPKRIPQSCITYTIEVINDGQGRAQDVTITDALPANTVLYTGDFEEGAVECGGNGTTATGDSPIDWDENNSGLTFSFLNLDDDPTDNGDSFEFLDASDNPITDFTQGFDPDVRKLVFKPSGTMLGKCCGAGPAQKSFFVRYRVQLQ